jgi:hypothetical protein
LVLELRHYVPVPGKEAALGARFRDLTFPLLDKLGYKVVGGWESVPSNGEFWYLMEWQSLEHMRTSWESFKTNADWQRIKELTEKDGPLVQRIESYPIAPSDIYSDYIRSRGHR